MNRRSKLMLLGGAAVATLGYAVGIEPVWIETVHTEIFCPRLPRAFDGLIVYQISDNHMTKFGRSERRLAAILNALPPADLVMLTGDMIHTRQGIEPFLKLAESIKARDGVYAVLGNSEYKNGVRPVEFAARLSRAGITPLLNQHVVYERNGAEMVIAGVEDPKSDMDDLDMALACVPDDLFKLVLMHSPDSVVNAVHHGVDLVLCGHTHGGQVILPPFGALITNSWMGNRVTSGHFHYKRMRTVIGVDPRRTQMYITRGIGTSALSLRFLCRPEFTILTLRRGPQRAVRVPVP